VGKQLAQRSSLAFAASNGATGAVVPAPFPF
jgi:hypothetical protein